MKPDYEDEWAHTYGNLTLHGGVGRGSTGRRDGSRSRSWLLGLRRACGRAHRGRRWPTPLSGEVRGGVRREGGLSLVTCTPLLPLATAAAAAGGATSADSWAQPSLCPCGEVINRAGQILEQKRGPNVSIYQAHQSMLMRSDMQQEATLNVSSKRGRIFLFDTMSWCTCSIATISA